MSHALTDGPFGTIRGRHRKMHKTNYFPWGQYPQNFNFYNEKKFLQKYGFFGGRTGKFRTHTSSLYGVQVESLNSYLRHFLTGKLFDNSEFVSAMCKNMQSIIKLIRTV
jgi:hypothetical protein